MPDSKITALTALTSADPANDMFPIVDVSDTSMAASGTTKRISINNLLAASGTATLASATITGDLTVRTTRLTTTTTGVGIGTAAPSEALHLLRSASNGIFCRFQDTTNSNYIGTDSGNFRIINGASQDLLNIQQLGVFTFGDGAGGTRMTLNSTGLGVGVVPSYLLHTAVASGANRNIARFQVTGASNGLTITWNHATTNMIVNFSNLPTSSAGLASGDLWIDTAAGNTLKVA